MHRTPYYNDNNYQIIVLYINTITERLLLLFEQKKKKIIHLGTEKLNEIS